MLNRRYFLAGLGIAAVSAQAGEARLPDRTPPARSPVDVLDPAQLHRVYRRMRYGSGSDPVFWWKRGRRYGVVDNDMTPLFDMHVGAAHACREVDEDRYEVVSASTMYFTDLLTGELLEDWRNPLTGRMVRLSYPAPRPAVAAYSYLSGVSAKAEMPGMRIVGRHIVEPLEVIGDEIWLREERWLTADVLSTGRTMKVHDMYALCSPLSALQDPHAAFVPALEQFNDYNDWSPRFDMDGHPGTSVARCHGRKVALLEEMPAEFLSLMNQVHPNAFRDFSVR